MLFVSTVQAAAVTIPNTFTAGTTSSAAQVNANFTAVKTAVDDNFARVVPAGAMMPFAGASAPAGWLLCNGAAVSRTVTYADLFAAIGVAWGGGDGSTTFNVPDMRGRFARGVDAAAGNDPDAATRTASNAGGNTGDAVGSLQADDFKSHVHGDPYAQGGVGALRANALDPASVSVVNSTSYFTGSSGGSETRPKNVGVTYIIKY